MITIIYFQRLSSENDRLNQLQSDLSHQVEELELQRKQMKKDIKELKFRETRNLADCSELEEENISLQKQVIIVYSLLLASNNAIF